LIGRNRDRKSQNIKKSRAQLGKIAIATYVNEKAISQTEKNLDRNQKIAIAELWEPSFMSLSSQFRKPPLLLLAPVKKKDTKYCDVVKTWEESSSSSARVHIHTALTT
jgi:hypothetical protein